MALIYHDHRVCWIGSLSLSKGNHSLNFGCSMWNRDWMNDTASHHPNQASSNSMALFVGCLCWHKKLLFSDTNGLELIIISQTILNDDIKLGVLAQTYQILLTSVEQKNYLILPTNIWALRPFLPQWIKPKSTDTLWHNTGLITERFTNPKRVQCHFPPSKRQVSTILQIFIKEGSIGTHSYKPWIKVRNLANSTSRPFRSLMLFISI